MVQYLILTVLMAFTLTGCKSGKSSQVRSAEDTKVQRQSSKTLKAEKEMQAQACLAPTTTEVDLTEAETKSIMDLLDSKLKDDAKDRVLNPVMGPDIVGSEVGIEFKGTFSKGHVVLAHKKSVLAEFKDLKLSLTEQTKIVKQNDYSLIAYCAEKKCELLFLTIYKVDSQNKVTENYPAIMKFDQNRYKRAKPFEKK